MATQRNVLAIADDRCSGALDGSALAAEPCTAMSTCPSCGTPVTSDLRFCVACGSALGSRCPSCGAATQPGSRFCGQCGMQLAPGEAAQATGLAAPPPPAAEVERRLVSVLFADLVGFTA